MKTTLPRRPAVLERTREQDVFRADILAGLRERPRVLPAKYFYDARGSQLFDAICELDEYYPTRTELALMDDHARAMARLLGKDVLLVEFGSGSSVKTRLLLDHLHEPAGYVPIDVSRDHLMQTARQLQHDYPHTEILPLCADFTQPLRLPVPQRQPARTAIYFPGSTIGNFDPPEAVQLLGRMETLCGPGGALLIGVDLRKDLAILEPAYNDRLGVTRDFNLNLLERINRELAANFPVDAFAHRATYNAELGCIEMFLVAQRQVMAEVAGERFHFARGEAIRTERSYKYTLEGFGELAARAGWQPVRVWVDREKLFSVHYLVAR